MAVYLERKLLFVYVNFDWFLKDFLIPNLRVIYFARIMIKPLSNNNAHKLNIP